MVVVDPVYVARTERLLIRPLKLDDAEDVLLMRKHPEVMLHTCVAPNSFKDPSDNTLDPSYPLMIFKRRKTGYKAAMTKVRPQLNHPPSTNLKLTTPDNNWNFAIELLRTTSPPRVVGLIGAVRAPEIGYMLNANHWGKGYATEALRAFMPLFFKHYSDDEGEYYKYAEALVDTKLISSQTVLAKAGFKLHEKRDKDFENPVLGLRDTLVYRMQRPEE
jgi:RimJ/RimL family protein N-acetyltransferase